MEIFKYRELIKALTLKELKVRYKRSILGFIWTLLNPLGMILIYWVIFSQLFTRFGIEKYALYLLSGVLPWNFLAISLAQSTISIVNNSNLIKKIYFPKEVFPLSIVFANLINFMLAMILLFGFLILSKEKIEIRILFLLPLLFTIQTVLVIGLSYIISCMNVFFADTSHLLEVGLLAWFFITPVFYPLEIINLKKFMFLYRCNPMLYLIESYHYIIYKGVLPPFKFLIISSLFALFFFILGKFILKKYEQVFAKVL